MYKKKKKIISLFSRPLFHSLIQGGAIVWQLHVLTTPMVTLIGFPFLEILFINAFIWSWSPETESPPTQSMKVNVIPRSRRCSLLGFLPFSLSNFIHSASHWTLFILLPPPPPPHPPPPLFPSEQGPSIEDWRWTGSNCVRVGARKQSPDRSMAFRMCL